MIWKIEFEEEDIYNSRLAAAVEKYSPPAVPQTETVNFLLLLQQCQPSTTLLQILSKKQLERMNNKGLNDHREHQDKISTSIGAEPYWNLIHHEISIKEAMNIEE